MHMKKNKINKVFTLCTILFVGLFYGCKKHNLNKINGLTSGHNVAVPLGYSNFDMHDLLMGIDSSITTNNLGEMQLAYEKPIDSVMAQEIIQLDDFSESFDITPPAFSGSSISSFNGTIDFASTENTDYVTQNGVELHTLNFESGSLTLNLSTTIQHDVTITVTMLDLLSSSVPIVRVLNLSYAGSIPQTASTVVDLTDVLSDFTAGGSTVNRLRVSVDATITGTGQPIVGNEDLSLTMNLSNLEFKNIIGYFGSELLNAVTDSTLLKIFENSNSGNLSFTNPSLKFTIYSSFGLPININFSSLSCINTLTNVSTPLGGFPTVIPINTPASMGQTAQTVITFDNTNTANISSIIDAAPKYLKYTTSITTNPNGAVLPLNFIESTSKMVIKAKITLPFEGYASGIAASDTIDFSYDQNVNNIESVMFRLYTENGFPLAFNGQATFVDSDYVPVFNLFNSPTQIVTAAPVNNLGLVTSASIYTTDININDAKILLMKNVKHIIISGIAETTQPANTIVKFYDFYRIKIKLGIQVQLKSTIII